MAYTLVDNCTSKAGAMWETQMIAEDSLEAVKEMWREWDALTKADQARRDEFYCISDDGQELYRIK